jgi:hypothetical protein
VKWTKIPNTSFIYSVIVEISGCEPTDLD